jgi:hypothetical protein
MAKPLRLEWGILISFERAATNSKKMFKNVICQDMTLHELMELGRNSKPSASRGQEKEAALRNAVDAARAKSLGLMLKRILRGPPSSRTLHEMIFPASRDGIGN